MDDLKDMLAALGTIALIGLAILAVIFEVQDIIRFS
jgi:hypothetical protein